MKSWIVPAVVLTLGVFVTAQAEAARLGGGRSLGAQRSIVQPRPAATPARPAQQAQPAAPVQQPAAAPAGAQSQPASGMSRWAPMLGGLAVGGLLGALFGGSGLAGMLMSWLMVAIVVFAVLWLWRTLAPRRGVDAQRLRYASDGGPAAFQALGNETVAAPPPSQAAGFEPWPAAAAVPAGFDVNGFLRSGKLNFMRLQAANDAGRLDDLRELTTPELYADLERDVLARGAQRQRTDVLSLHADLLEVTTDGDAHWASVRFSGQVAESQGLAAQGFEEVWNLRKPVDGSTGWLLAGIQQMH